MNTYAISNKNSGLTLGTYSAEDEQGARDAMARDAGYADYSECCQETHSIGDELSVTEITYQAIEDNGGGLHLAIFAGGDCTHLVTGLETQPGALRGCIKALEDGDHPSSWDGLSDDPQAEYNQMIGYAFGHKVVADSNGTYPDRMGASARVELG